MSRSVRDEARSWLNGQILSTRSCMERLGSIQNDAVNVAAQRGELSRMARDVRVWEFMLAAVDALPADSKQLSLLDADAA